MTEVIFTNEKESLIETFKCVHGTGQSLLEVSRLLDCRYRNNITHCLKGVGKGGFQTLFDHLTSTLFEVH